MPLCKATHLECIWCSPGPCNSRCDTTKQRVIQLDLAKEKGLYIISGVKHEMPYDQVKVLLELEDRDKIAKRVNEVGQLLGTSIECDFTPF